MGKISNYWISKIVLIPILILGWYSVCSAQNFSHIKTFGFDYVDFRGRYNEASWISKRHDWIVGGGPVFDKKLLETIKSANSNVKVMRYLAYHSVSPEHMEWMENWCKQNGFNPEDLYYHYYRDTIINLVNGKSITVPGYGDGSAKSLEEARLRVRWNGGWVGINPSSIAWRAASQALALTLVKVEGTKNTYAEGLFLDTFDGLVNDGKWSSYPENTIEMRHLKSVKDVYSKIRHDLVASKIELESYLRKKTNNPSFVVMANVGDVDMAYKWRSDIYKEHRQDIMDLCVEYLITTTTSVKRIQRLKDLYEDMENGRKIFIRSQTNVSPAKMAIPFGYTQFVLAAHYLINHKNGHFFYHEGNASFYGGYPYGKLRTTHWHINQEENIGIPEKRSQKDYWGKRNTDRFFIFQNDKDAKILGRYYSKALVLAKFGKPGWRNIGKGKRELSLRGKYRRLQEDNSLGPVIEKISLGYNEGAILMHVKE